MSTHDKFKEKNEGEKKPGRPSTTSTQQRYLPNSKEKKKDKGDN